MYRFLAHLVIKSRSQVREKENYGNNSILNWKWWLDSRDRLDLKCYPTVAATPDSFRMHLPVLCEYNGAFSCRTQNFPETRTLPHVNKNSDTDPYKNKTFALARDSFSISPAPACVFAVTVEHRAGITLGEEETVAGVRHKAFPEFIIFKYKVLQACCLLCQTAICFLSI